MNLQLSQNNFNFKTCNEYGQLIFDKRAKKIQQRNDNLFNIWYWIKLTSTYKKMNLGTDLTPYKNVNSKWIIGLNVKCKTIKLLEDNWRKSR